MSADPLDLLRPADDIGWAGSFTEPLTLAESLVARATAFAGARLWTTQLQPPALVAAPGVTRHIAVTALLSSPALAGPIAEGRVAYLPVRYREIPRLLAAGLLRARVAVLQVAPAGPDGRHSFGATVGYLPALVAGAERVIVEVNQAMPRTLGHTGLDPARIDARLTSNRPLPEYPREAAGDEERAIAEHLARLVPDGATLQVGLGRLPDAALEGLVHRRDLGVYSGMLSDRLVDLCERGVITNARTVEPGRMVATTAIGTQRLYRWIDRNERVAMRSAEETNDPARVAMNPQPVAINTVLEVDLLGQANAERIPTPAGLGRPGQGSGGRLVGGYGGLLDFLDGARASPKGRAILVLRAASDDGTRSNLVARLRAPPTVGAGALDFVVTEYGVAEIAGAALPERARRLARIAHPSHRAALLQAAAELG